MPVPVISRMNGSTTPTGTANLSLRSSSGFWEGHPSSHPVRRVNRPPD
jgi:hypothetical protein